jgi:hypothetical protein
MRATTDLEFMAEYYKEIQAIAQRVKDELPQTSTGWSENLENLAYKIGYMISRHRTIDVPVMLKKIATGRIKKHTKPGWPEGEFCGYGHFRYCGTNVVTLTKAELERVREYFKIEL